MFDFLGRIGRAKFGIIATACVAGLASAFASAPANAASAVIFTEQFLDNPIVVDGRSTLQFTIENQSGSTVSGLQFTDNLPSGVTIASPANETLSTCDRSSTASVSATAGGSTITFTGGELLAGQTCTIEVDVTSSTIGTYTNTTGDLVADSGAGTNYGSASDDLVVNDSAPLVFSQAFSPSTVSLGGQSRLTYTIENTDGTFITSLAFTDSLPTGLEVSDFPDVSNTCSGTASATAGSSTVSLSLGSLTAAGTCTVEVNVRATGTGSLYNETTLTSSAGSRTSSDVLTVTEPSGDLQLSKSFTDDPAYAGGTVTLEFTLQNTDRSFTATDIAFTDDLDATLSGLVASAASLPTDPCGSGSSLSGTSTLSLTGGSLGAEESCTFSVTLDIPAGAATGSYSNATSAVSGTIDGSAASGDAATDLLFIQAQPPTFSMQYTVNPVQGGDTATLQFTIENPSSTTAMTDIAFQDNLSEAFGGAPPTVTGGTGSNVCGSGSFFFTQTISGAQTLVLSGGNLAASGSCTFSVDFAITDQPAGDYTNVTGQISATVSGDTVYGGTASDTLTVTDPGGEVQLSKSFTGNGAPGQTVDLEFVLTNPNEDFAATDIQFTDDLDAMLSGAVATGLPASDVCGSGSQISGTSLLSLTGASLDASGSCTFTVTVQIPAGAAAGTYTNTTSDVTATVDGSTGVSYNSAATADLTVDPAVAPTFTKEFIDDPAIPGGEVTLRFTIDNSAADTGALTAMFFTDNLSTTLSGLASTSGTLSDVCGSGSQISGTTSLVFTGGNLPAGDICTFDVTLSVPAGATSNTYGNLTSDLTVTIDGTGTTVDGAFDTLTVEEAVIYLSKSFVDNPVLDGDTVALEFTLENSSGQTVTDIAFSDDLDSMLSGATAVLPNPRSCLTGATEGFGGTYTFADGELAAGEICTFSIDVSIPAAATSGTYTNTTSTLTGLIGALAVSGDAASDDLTVNSSVAPTLTKTFTDDPTGAGQTVVLEFNISNPPGGSARTNLSFSDDLDAVLSGLVSTSGTQSVCGGGSLSGTSTLTFSGGSLAIGESCTFSATLQIPATAAVGDYVNTTSDLSENGLDIAAGATDTLTIEPAPGFAKAFSPDSILTDETSTLTFTIDNSSATVSATSLDFTDTLPAGLTVATTPAASTTCTSGTLSAAAGSGTVSYTGGTVSAGSTCTVQVDIAPSVAGSFVNTSGDLTSSLGDSGAASDTLTVTDLPPGFAKVFSPDELLTDETSTLTFTIDNSGATTAATSLAFSDTFPSGVVLASPTGATTTCTGGSITGSAGDGSFSFSGGTVVAGDTCAVSVDVTSATAGSYVNTSADLTSSLGNSGTATDSLLVVDRPPSFAKVFAPDAILVDEVSTLTFTIDNSGATTDVTALDFTDSLPTDTEVAVPPNASTTCIGGTLSAVAGSSTITYTGGAVTGGSTCTVNVDVTSPVAGTYVNTTGDLTSSLGNSGTATDTLVATDGPPVFTKEFSPDTIFPGETSTLTFTVDNSAATTDATALSFSDSFPSGMEVAATPNTTNGCGGTLTATAGASSVNYASGSVSGGASCTITVDVTASPAGTYANTSGALSTSLGSAGTATDTLTVVDEAPLFSKAFSPASIVVDGTSTLTFTIDNTGATTDAASLDFSDSFPSGMTVAATPNASTTCTGGTLTAAAGADTVSYAGGTVTGGTSCDISLDVTASLAGSYDNTSGDLTSTLGNSGTASDTLTVVDEAPLFSKAFVPDSIVTGEASTLTFTIDATAGSTDVTDIAFDDNFPTGLIVATDPNISNSCGGTLTATSESDSISFVNGTLTGGTSCEIAVDVTSADAGSYTNTTGDLTSSLGNSGTASDALTVTEADIDLSVDLSVTPNPVVAGEQATYTVTVENSDTTTFTARGGSPTAITTAPNVVATVTLPSQVTFVSTSGCAEDPNGIPTCSLGDIPPGGSASFTYTVTVDDDATGTLVTEVAISTDFGGVEVTVDEEEETTPIVPPEGTITIVKNTAPAAAGDDTFVFSSDDADFDGLTLTTVANTASSGAIEKVAGSYTISEVETEGWQLASITCTGDTDSGSAVDLDNSEVVIDLDNDEAIVCTFTNVRDGDAVIEQTHKVIMEFMEKRADQITANTPDLTSRLRDRGTSDSPGTLVGFANPLNSDFTFATSLGQLSAYRQSLLGGVVTEERKLDAWIEARFTHNSTDNSDFRFGSVHLGADYLVNPDLVVGGLVEFDWSGLDSNTDNSSAKGFGWMAGPYFVARPWQNIYVDGHIGWGQSYNEVDPFGLYTDDFDTTRWLITTSVSGDYKYGGLTVRPGAEFLYFHETQHSYVDSLSVTIPEQTLSLGRLIFGPEFEYEILMDNGIVLAPTFSIDGIWDFHEAVSSSSTASVDDDDFRGRVELGLGISSPSGIRLRASGFYDGVGLGDYDTYGGKVELTVPFQ